MPAPALKYQVTDSKPAEFRDFSRGRITKYSANNKLAPVNSVSQCQNVNFDTIIGSGVVRPGTTKLGDTVASGKTPLGLYNFVSPGGALNLGIAAFSGASTATISYYDTSWHASGLTGLNNSATVNFATLGGQVFMANGVDVMKSSADGNTWGTTNSTFTGESVIPSLVYRAKGRMLCSGWSTRRDRVYFSSIIDPTSSPFITWNSNATTGDWIDINPDDGSNVTAFAETSNTVLVFKSQGMYRLDVVAKNVDTQNIFNIGAVSQKAVTTVQGIVYFFSGIDIRRTDGTYPEQISRLGVQDFIDAIPQANWANVCAGNDGFNAYFSIGDVTLNTGRDGQKTYSSVVLKYSTRDEAWSVHSYAQTFRFFTQMTTSVDGRKMIGADTLGNVQTINKGTTDNGTEIFYDLETQELEFGNRAHTNTISDLISIFCKNGAGSSMQVKATDKDYRDIQKSLPKRVNVVDNFSVEGEYFTFRWFGSTSLESPVFEGFYIERIKDEGMVNS